MVYDMYGRLQYYEIAQNEERGWGGEYILCKIVWADKGTDAVNRHSCVYYTSETLNSRVRYSLINLGCQRRLAWPTNV